MKIYSKKNIFLIFLLIALLFGSAVYFSISLQKRAEQERQVSLPSKYTTCLRENEYVDYKIEKNPLGGGIVKIFIRDKDSNQERFSFQIEISNSEHYHPVEIHRCGVYALRTFGYDYQKKIPLENYKRELWRYKYNGEGIPLISDSAKWAHENILGDFRVDPTETLVVLKRSYFGNPEYALVIKNLNNKEDVFLLLLKEIIDKYPALEGSIGFNEWTKDGRYFWANIFVGANVLGFIRIDTGNLTYEVFQAPEGVLGGDALSVENGYITIHPDNIWFGDLELINEEKERRRKKGIGTELYVENLFTHKRQFVTSTTEPLYYFKPRWLSDTELEYELPTGEKKIYKINEK